MRLWERMGVLYGREWTSQYGVTPLKPDGRALTAFGEEWAGVIRGVDPARVMQACDKARDSGNGFAPRAPEFRLWCFDIPSRDDCEAYLRGQTEPVSFTVEVARQIDMWNWKGSPTWEANKILQAAYDAVRKRVLAGEVLPPVRVAIEKKATKHVPADPVTAAKHIAAIGALLGLNEPTKETS